MVLCALRELSVQVVSWADEHRQEASECVMDVYGFSDCVLLWNMTRRNDGEAPTAGQCMSLLAASSGLSAVVLRLFLAVPAVVIWLGGSGDVAVGGMLLG